MSFRILLIKLLETLLKAFRPAKFDFSEWSKKSNLKTPQVRRKLSRDEVLQFIQLNNGSQDLDLSNTDLTEIDLSEIDLRKINLSQSSLRNVNFTGANLSEAKLDNTYCRNTDFTKSNLSDANLSSANCASANFFQANLYRAKLKDTYFRAANLAWANLYRAILDGANFEDANLTFSDLYRASMTNTKLSRENLGNAILQDNVANFENKMSLFLKNQYQEHRQSYLRSRLFQAEDVYRTLKILFMNSGQYSDASWAYIKERQARRKTHHFSNSYQCYYYKIVNERKPKVLFIPWFHVKHFVKWLSDWGGELSCGYGEKPLRTVAWAGVILIIFPFIYWLIGGIVSDTGPMTWLDYFNYSFGAFTTLGFSEFRAITPLAQTLTSIEALLGIAVLALVMFALGNRISRA